MTTGDRLFVDVSYPVEDPKRAYWYASVLDWGDLQKPVACCPHKHLLRKMAVRCGKRLLRKYPCSCRRTYDKASRVVWEGEQNCLVHRGKS
jgi:hypothetical protein